MPAGAVDAAGPLLDKFLAENPSGVKDNRLNQMRHDVSLFFDVFGVGTAITDLDKRAVRDWKELLLQWPVKATETTVFRGLTMQQVITANETEGKPTISAQTVNRHLSSLSAFCNWAEVSGYLDTNPVHGMQLRKVQNARRATFTSDQLNTLFQSPLYTGCAASSPWRDMAKQGDVLICDHRYWVPLIMMYSGARPAEIGQLATSDIRQEHGTWIMHITTEGEGEKSTKTAGSMRVVPIHSQLIALGFLDYHKVRIAAKDVRLFPDAKRNNLGQMLADFSREFSRYLSRIGMDKDHGLSLYSFRHGAADALRRAGYLDDQFGYILGHTGATMTGRYGNLPQGMLEQRVGLIEAIEYPDLDLRHLH
ncbi:MAG: site-specific integrase [Sulfitobacter sp.]